MVEVVWAKNMLSMFCSVPGDIVDHPKKVNSATVFTVAPVRWEVTVLIFEYSNHSRPV